MALDGTKVFLPAEGHFYLAPVGTPYPAAPTAPAAPYVEIGHTQRDSPFTTSYEGGEQTVLGTLQSPSLRVSTAPVTTTIGFGLHQYDEDNLQLFYGGGTFDALTGLFWIPRNRTPQEHAMFVRFIDGTKEQPRYYPKISIVGATDGETLDTAALAVMPVLLTILDDGTSDGMYAIGIAAPTP